MPDELKQEFIDVEGEGDMGKKGKEEAVIASFVFFFFCVFFFFLYYFFFFFLFFFLAPSLTFSLFSFQKQNRDGIDTPLLTTTSTNVLRYMGKYLHMIKILQPIAISGKNKKRNNKKNSHKNMI